MAVSADRLPIQPLPGLSSTAVAGVATGAASAIAATLAARGAGHGRGGVFWQTQGSGKSFSMVFFAQKILRKVSGNWTFVIITDRMELDDQIAKTFKACGAVSESEGDECHAQSGAHLRELLRGNHRYVFTLIHKFQTTELLCDRRDVIVLTDEAHRSQYDTLALNMRAALPNALFLAFTGTPLIVGEERTREVFGDYVSIYDFQQSVEDGATVPLFYENRTPELRLENLNLNEDIYALIEEAELSEEAETRLERELGKQYHSRVTIGWRRLPSIARANRVFPGKHSGLIVDYANLFASLEKELAIYAQGHSGATPVRDKAQLVAELRKAVEDTVTFCASHGVSIAAIEHVAPGSIERLTFLADAVNALISPDPLRKEFLAHARLIHTLFQAVKPDPAVKDGGYKREPDRDRVSP